jgi:hypothetical protein
VDAVPISTVVTLGIALVSAGAVFGKLMSIAEKVKGLERSREKLGERVGALEKSLAVERERRRVTGLNLPRVGGGGQVAAPVHDDSEEGSNDHG